MQPSQDPASKRDERSRRTVARARIADFHQRRQEELLRPVTDLIDRHRRGEADVWEVDAQIRVYEKATRELQAQMSFFYRSSIPLHFLLEFLDRDARGEDPWGFLMGES